LKVRVILLPVKLILESVGVASMRIGGRVSLGPPVGGIILAQPEEPIIKIVLKKTRIRERYREAFFIYC
jgi:hypothetical protein